MVLNREKNRCPAVDTVGGAEEHCNCMKTACGYIGAKRLIVEKRTARVVVGDVVVVDYCARHSKDPAVRTGG